MKTAFLTLITTTLLFFSCKKNVEESPPDVGYNYYPGKMKSFIVYDVDSIVYKSLGHSSGSTDTSNYKFQIKEVMDSLITDNQNRPTIKIIRYKKIHSDTIPYSEMTWVLQDVWVANKTNTNVEVVEENKRYIKLAFPTKINNSWNGTAHDSAVSTYTYISFDVPLTFNGLSFDKTLTVKQDNYQQNILNYKNYREQYARNVGLIYKEITDYTYLQDSQGLHPGVIADGQHYVMTINSFGTE